MMRSVDQLVMILKISELSSNIRTAVIRPKRVSEIIGTVRICVNTPHNSGISADGSGHSAFREGIAGGDHGCRNITKKVGRGIVKQWSVGTHPPIINLRIFPFFPINKHKQTAHELMGSSTNEAIEETKTLTNTNNEQFTSVRR